MSDLYVITGFLGAGKSTLLAHVLQMFKGKKIRLIVNEFGQVGVDGILLKELDAELKEITGGSVFCSCRIDQFEQALRTFVEQDTEIVLVEASGLSDPTGVRNLLTETERFPHITYRGLVCLVDAVRFPKVYAKSRTCVKQLAAADVAVLNQIDRASEAQLDAVRALIRDQRPDIPVYETSFGRVGDEVLAALDRRSAVDAKRMPLTADLTVRSLTIRVEPGIPLRTLRHFLNRFLEMTFRVKGFVETGEGICLVDCVGNRLSIRPWESRVPAEQLHRLVILSGVGMPVKKHVREAIRCYPGQFAELSIEAKEQTI